MHKGCTKFTTTEPLQPPTIIIILTAVSDYEQLKEMVVLSRHPLCCPARGGSITQAMHTQTYTLEGCGGLCVRVGKKSIKAPCIIILKPVSRHMPI